MQPERPLRLLHLEDNADDAELIRYYLDEDGLRCDIVRVDNGPRFTEALKGGGFDIVICDFNLPSYDGISALKLAREVQPLTPVLLISGTLDEEDAVKSLQMGATDYLVKQRLNRLGPAVRRALQEARHQHERWLAEQALRVSEERFRLLVENSSDLICEASIDGRFLYTSPNFHSVLGYESAELLGSNAFEKVHPDDLDGMRSAFGGADARTESRYRHRDGSYQWFEITSRTFRTRNGERRAGIMARDISERRVLEAQLRQSQKMETIGHLAGGVAHDFNNILTVIQGQASLVCLDGNLDAFAREAVSEIMEAATRAANLTRQLLTVSRKQLMQTRAIDLNAVVHEMTRMLQRTLGPGIALEVKAAPDLPPVQADPGMMEQILMNLAVNSRDAMPDGGRLEISTSTVLPDEETKADMGGASLGICLRVTDTGCGIPPENLPRIFEPFFTTKDPQKGTGLGLATVCGIVKQHRGSIRLGSEVGQGTTFEIVLPASRAAAEPVARKATELSMSGGNERILVVDDDPSVRGLIVHVLKGLGYEVLEASSGKQALAVFEHCHGEIDLLLTDMAMPDGMSGKELTAQLRGKSPALRVIFTSGHSADFIGGESEPRSAFHFLQKPFCPRTLARAIRECLDGNCDSAGTA